MAGRGHGPDTFRPLMFPAICEKAFHVVTMAVLFGLMAFSLSLPGYFQIIIGLFCLLHGQVLGQGNH